MSPQIQSINGPHAQTRTDWSNAHTHLSSVLALVRLAVAKHGFAVDPVDDSEVACARVAHADRQQQPHVRCLCEPFLPQLVLALKHELSAPQRLEQHELELDAHVVADAVGQGRAERIAVDAGAHLERESS